MNYKEFNVAVPIKANNVILIEGVMQFDTANIVNVRLMDGAEPFDFTGYVHIFLEILKPDGNVVQAAVTNNNEILNIDQLGVADNDPYNFHIVDPADGRISFTLKDQATILNGTHFMQLVVMGSGERLTTARINYYVGETMLEDMPGISSTSDYAALLEMYRQVVRIEESERAREDSEAQRTAAEQLREKGFRELHEDIETYLSNAESYVETSESHLEEMQILYDFAMSNSPSAEIVRRLIADLMLTTKEEVEDLIESATKDFDAGEFDDTEDESKLLKFKAGEKENIPVLEDGEPGWATDEKVMYIGTADGNMPINGVYEASVEAPGRTDILWIDLSADGVIKYYDGESWQPTATATFA